MFAHYVNYLHKHGGTGEIMEDASGYSTLEQMREHQQLCPMLFAIEYKRVELQPCVIEWYADHMPYGERNRREEGCYGYWKGVLFMFKADGTTIAIGGCSKKGWGENQYKLYPNLYKITPCVSLGQLAPAVSSRAAGASGALSF